MFLKAFCGHSIGESLLSWNTIPPPLSKGGRILVFEIFAKKGGLSDFSHKKRGVGKLTELF